MKNLTFRLLALLFWLCRLCPVQKGKAVLLRHFADWGSLAPLGDALKAAGYRVVRVARWTQPGTLFHLATADVVFLNNNFNLLRYLRFSKKTRLVQLWHGEGAWKQWGLSAEKDTAPLPYTAAVCSSRGVAPYWSEALGLPPAQVLPFGSPRIDALRKPFNKQALRAIFDQQHPSCKGKRLFLYAPTFRADPAQNAALLSHFDFAAFDEQFGGQAMLLMRLHPAIHSDCRLPRCNCALDVTGLPDPLELLRVCDVFVTDYSSLCFSAAALGLPIVIFAFDAENYTQHDRGFYVSPLALPPGKIARTFPHLLAALASPEGPTEKQQREAFTAFHLGATDGKSCERIIDWLR
ncbi:MAG: CDP-glycerol glycerophosphotransferase family protein [Oscillospiraceae bacterium]|jgi:CDP-ribitol ribitolphosphotransferase|nr:CDP-glycerol glycerophosphotransferase family protein [Oscillospiraceae bacterium]